LPRARVPLLRRPQRGCALGQPLGSRQDPARGAKCHGDSPGELSPRRLPQGLLRASGPIPFGPGSLSQRRFSFPDPATPLPPRRPEYLLLKAPAELPSCSSDRGSLGFLCATAQLLGGLLVEAASAEFPEDALLGAKTLETLQEPLGSLSGSNHQLDHVHSPSNSMDYRDLLHTERLATSALLGAGSSSQVTSIRLGFPRKLFYPEALSPWASTRPCTSEGSQAATRSNHDTLILRLRYPKFSPERRSRR